jgi:hypothetical protein
MKVRFVIIPVLLLCTVFACKKAKGPANGNSVQQNNNLDSTVSVSAVINGVNWQTDSAIGYSVKYSGNDSGVSNLMITASNKKNAIPSTITFYVTSYTGPNTYKINPPVNSAYYYLGNTRHLATKGTLVVASDTAYSLRGTFSFTADTITVASGTFNVATP